LKLTKSDRRGNLKPEAVEALLLNKYHSINLENPEIRTKAISKYEEITTKLSIQSSENRLKRKSSQISPVVDQNELDYDDDDGSTDKLNFKQIKINSQIFHSLESTVRIDLEKE